MIKSIAFILVGLVLAFGALWGGAYAMSGLTPQDWQTFPIFMTACYCWVGGVWSFVWGLASFLEKRQ